MSNTILNLLEDALQNPSLQQKLHSATTPDRFVNIAAENGHNLTANELAQTLGQFHVVFGQVVESMLDSMDTSEDNLGGDQVEKISGTNVELVKRLFSRGETFDAEGFVTFFTDNPIYQFGNFEICLDKESIKKSVENFFSQINAIYHEIKMIWEIGDLVFVEMDVTYWRKNNSKISLPCTDIFRVEGDKFSELRIFMDINPLFDLNIAVSPSASVLTASAGKSLIPPGTMKRHFAEHPEAKQRVIDGYVPKWALTGPQWKIDESATDTKTSEQLDAVVDLSQAIIGQNWAKVKSYLTDDIFYKVGSGKVRYGKQEVIDFFTQTFKNTAIFTGHKPRKVWQESDIIAVEMDAYYEMVGTGKQVIIACCDIYRMRGNKVSEWRVYADMSPWSDA